MFIWTIGDIIGVTLLAISAIGFGTLLSIIWIQDWLVKRRRNRC